MAKSAYVTALDEIQGVMTAFLKPLGFKKSGRAYNRAVEDGLVQVVGFQMGEYPIGQYVIPGMRESFYGRFTVNLGVMLPAVRDMEYASFSQRFVPEYHCEIRSRLGSLGNAGEDVWWDLDYHVARTGTAVVDTMREIGIPFLDRFRNYENVLAALEKDGELPQGNAGRSALAGALICHALDRPEEARKWFDRAIAYSANLPRPNKGFEAHVVGLKGKCGL
jgi:Domain of unknown function (DUF4304)